MYHLQNEHKKREPGGSRTLDLFSRNGGYLDQPFISEGKITIGGDDQVIQDGHIQHLAALNQLFGQVDICFRGLGIPAGMVMKQYYRRCIGLEGMLEDDFGVCDSAGNATGGNLGNPQGPVRAVHQQDCKGFPVFQVVPKRQHEFIGIARTCNLWAIGSLDLG